MIKQYLVNPMMDGQQIFKSEECTYTEMLSWVHEENQGRLPHCDMYIEVVDQINDRIVEHVKLREQARKLMEARRKNQELKRAHNELVVTTNYEVMDEAEFNYQCSQLPDGDSCQPQYLTTISGDTMHGDLEVWMNIKDIQHIAKSYHGLI